MSADAVNRRRVNAAGPVHAAAAAALILVVAVIAIRSASSGPPPIAEFAPQAEQIKAAPPEETSSFGNGLGALGPGTPSPSPSPASLPVASLLRHCVGDPPRQIEDPQSPPCVAFWAGTDNGGVTTQGVTSQEIHVALESGENSGTSTGTNRDYTQDLVNFFNSRFEMYGRRIVIDPYAASNPCFTREPALQGPSTSSCGQPADMEADANVIGSVHKDFADLGYGIGANGDGSEYYFYDLLAQKHVLTVQFPSHEGATYMPESHYDEYAPYEWNYLPSFDRDLASLGSFVCRQLAGHAPAYAGAPQNTQPQRVFGLLVENYSNSQAPDITPLTSATSACGAPFTVVHYSPGAGNQVGPIVQLSSAHVTSVACVCMVNELTQTFMQAASGQDFHPEWLITNYGTQDDEYEIGWTAPQDQASHILGLMGFNKWLPGDQRPVTWAVNEVDPGQCPANCYNWELWAPYWELLVLASGIQMAGPHLSAATFQSGLFRTQFPNPGCGGPPYYQACVGFGPHDHTMLQDWAMVWWNPNAQQAWQSPLSPSGGKAGAYCYIGRGTRLSLGWPAAPQPFDSTSLPCR